VTKWTRLVLCEADTRPVGNAGRINATKKGE